MLHKLWPLQTIMTGVSWYVVFTFDDPTGWLFIAATVSFTVSAVGGFVVWLIRRKRSINQQKGSSHV